MTLTQGKEGGTKTSTWPLVAGLDAVAALAVGKIQDGCRATTTSTKCIGKGPWGERRKRRRRGVGFSRTSRPVRRSMFPSPSLEAYSFVLKP